MPQKSFSMYLKMFDPKWRIGTGKVEKDDVDDENKDINTQMREEPIQDMRSNLKS